MYDTLYHLDSPEITHEYKSVMVIEEDPEEALDLESPMAAIAVVEGGLKLHIFPAGVDFDKSYELVVHEITEHGAQFDHPMFSLNREQALQFAKTIIATLEAKDESIV